jgi:4-diphosphocytidyl-2C-methyl-D-erythritol kinase
LREADYAELGRCLHNDLQEAALRHDERLRHLWNDLRSCLRETEAKGCLLSGSGSSFFVLAEDQDICRRCATIVESELEVPCVVANSYPAWHTRVEKLIARRGSL